MRFGVCSNKKSLGSGMAISLQVHLSNAKMFPWRIWGPSNQATWGALRKWQNWLNKIVYRIIMWNCSKWHLRKQMPIIFSTCGHRNPLLLRNGCIKRVHKCPKFQSIEFGHGAKLMLQLVAMVPVRFSGMAWSGLQEVLYHHKICSRTGIWPWLTPFLIASLGWWQAWRSHDVNVNKLIFFIHIRMRSIINSSRSTTHV